MYREQRFIKKENMRRQRGRNIHNRMQENIMQKSNYVTNDVTEFSKDTYTISHTILIEEVVRYELDKCKIT